TAVFQGFGEQARLPRGLGARSALARASAAPAPKPAHPITKTGHGNTPIANPPCRGPGADPLLRCQPPRAGIYRSGTRGAHRICWLHGNPSAPPGRRVAPINRARMGVETGPYKTQKTLRKGRTGKTRSARILAATAKDRELKITRSRDQRSRTKI